MQQKTWDDNLLFYGGEALFLLVAEGYIAYQTYDGPASIPFCIGLLITALVAGIGMHWALTKLSKKLIGSGYFVWLGISAFVGFTAAVLWMAADRRADHQKTLAESAAKVAHQQRLEIEKLAASTQQQVTSNLTTMAAIQPLLDKAKTTKERQEILKLAQQMQAQANPTATPDLALQVQAAVAATQPAKPKEIEPEWQPFEAGGFLDVWHTRATRLCSILGLIGLAILLGAFVVYRNEEMALRHAQAGSQTTTTVTTNAAQHNPPHSQSGTGFTPMPVTARQEHQVAGFGRQLPAPPRINRRVHPPSQPRPGAQASAAYLPPSQPLPPQSPALTSLPESDDEELYNGYTRGEIKAIIERQRAAEAKIAQRDALHAETARREAAASKDSESGN